MTTLLEACSSPFKFAQATFCLAVLYFTFFFLLFLSDMVFWCLQTNTSVACSLGPYFFPQISVIFLDMLTVYRYFTCSFQIYCCAFIFLNWNWSMYAYSRALFLNLVSLVVLLSSCHVYHLVMNYRDNVSATNIFACTSECTASWCRTLFVKEDLLLRRHHL